jgi:hypothetical protein
LIKVSALFNKKSLLNFSPIGIIKKSERALVNITFKFGFQFMAKGIFFANNAQWK